ncbi:MAG: hypothetical protein M0Z40_03685, partial [Actinomycetota bacterium]|nr:hypothetical protein [Actinomycetota bacterium]
MNWTTVPQRVLDQVIDDAAISHDVDARRDGVRRVQRYGDTRRVELLGLGGEGILHEVREVYRGRLQMDGIRVALGHEEQTVGEVDDSVDFAGRSPDRCREVFRRAPGPSRKLEFRPQDRERAPQLMAGCRREASLAFESGVEATEQVVEGDGESCELVVGRGHTQSRVVVAFGDARRFAAHALNRCECPTGEEPPGNDL